MLISGASKTIAKWKEIKFTHSRPGQTKKWGQSRNAMMHKLIIDISPLEGTKDKKRAAISIKILFEYYSEVLDELPAVNQWAINEEL